MEVKGRSNFKPRGRFILEHRDSKGVLKSRQLFKNAVVDEGLEALLDALFNEGTQPTNWYMGLVNNSGWTAFANADTMAAHAGWVELVAYTEATRPEWLADAAASRAVTNSTTTDFSINGTATVKGIFVASENTKSGTTGILWATASLATAQPVSSGDTLKITYTVSG